MRAWVAWEAKWTIRCVLALIICVAGLYAGARFHIEALTGTAAIAGFIAFCFASLSAVDTFTAWSERQREREDVEAGNDESLVATATRHRTSA